MNSEAINGTRPWSVYREGPSNEAKEIPSYQLSKISFVHSDIRFTTKGETLYAIALGWPLGQPGVDQIALKQNLVLRTPDSQGRTAGGEG